MHPRALTWIVRQPEFDPFCDYPHSNHNLGTLFEHAIEQGTDDVEILRAAATIAQRRPDVRERQRNLPRMYCDRDNPDVIKMWQDAADCLIAMRALAALPPTVRDEIQVFVARQKAWRGVQSGL
jgi:hypothetical protein